MLLFLFKVSHQTLCNKAHGQEYTHIPDVSGSRFPQLLVIGLAIGGSSLDEVGGAVPQARHSFLSDGFDTRHVEHDHCPVKSITTLVIISITDH